MTHPLAAEAAQALQGMTKLVADCELAAKVMAETGTFETGQAILKEAAAALTALSAEADALKAQVAEALAAADDAAEYARKAEAQVAELTRERDAWFEGAGAHHVASMKQAQRADIAEAKLARLLDANWRLRSYAVHDNECTVNKPPHFDVTKCSCGLRAALTEGTPE